MFGKFFFFFKFSIANWTNIHLRTTFLRFMYILYYNFYNISNYFFINGVRSGSRTHKKRSCSPFARREHFVHKGVSLQETPKIRRIFYWNAFTMRNFYCLFAGRIWTINHGVEPVSNDSYETSVLTKIGIGRGSRTRTYECRSQIPVPYQLGDTPIKLQGTYKRIKCF